MKTRLLVPLLLAAGLVPAALVYAAPVRRVADLQSIFHGSPAAPKKAPPPAVTATVATAAGLASDLQVEDFFRAFAAAIKARDGVPMRPRLADKYTVVDLPDGHKAADLFVMGVEQTPGPEAITIQSIETKGAVRTVKAEIRYATKTVVKTFRFDAEGRLLASDLFKMKVETRGHGA